jgi:hypothetical protein
MARKKLTRTELQKRGMDILVRELGYPSAVEFILDCNRKRGDYTKERRKLFAGVTVEQVLAESAKITAKERSKLRRKSA